MNVVFAIDERNHKVHTSKVDKPGAERKSDEGKSNNLSAVRLLNISYDQESYP